MDIELAGSGVTYRPNDAQLAGLSLEFAAFDGEVGIGQLPFPDPAAAISVYDGRSARVDEGAALLTDGYIIDQDRERGPMPAGTARLHTFSVMDANALLDGFRVERTRPAETDVARVLAFAALDGTTWDTTWVVDENTVTMPGKTYAADGGWTGEFIPDLVEFTGKTLFLHDLADGTGRCLHYHILEDGHACGLAISDQTPNGPETWNPWDPRRQRTSVDLRNDVKMRDQTGRTSTVTDATSISLHDADGLQHQALIDVEAESQADLDVKAAAMLASVKDERDTWTCGIGPLDEDALALIRVGDLIEVTSSVMGLTASTQRIAHMTLSPVIGEGGRAAEGYWMAVLELGAPVRRRARVNTKIVAAPAAPIYPDDEWTCVPSSLRVPWGQGTESGTARIEDPTFFGEQFATSVSTTSGGGTMTLYDGVTYLMSVSGYPGSLTDPITGIPGPYVGDPDWGWIEFAGIADAGGGHDIGTDMGAYPYMGISGPPAPVFFSYGQVFTQSDTRTDMQVLVHAVNDVDHNSYGWQSVAYCIYQSGPDPRFIDLPACTNGAPRVGQRVRQTSFLGDGYTLAFTTDFPFAAGSLSVFVNGLDWTLDIATSDLTTGDVTMLYPFPLDSTVDIRYRRAA